MKGIIIVVSAIVFGVITAIYLLLPIRDPDFFWHIATGRWIVENLRLPDSDPFAYTTPPLHHDRELFILRSYWLSQVVYWLSYRLWGYNGIILLRFIIVSILFYILYKRTLSETNDGLITLWLLTVSSIFILINYPLERPQIWSFVLFNILLFILQRRSSLYFIPPLMTLWANMHGGYILGSVTIIVYIAENLVNRFILKKEVLNRDLLLWGIVGILAGFINPCTYLAVKETLTISESMKKGIIEYQSSIEKLLIRNNFTVFVYWSLLLLAIAGVAMGLFKGRIESHEIIFTIGLGYFSFTESRFIAFFIIWAIPLIGASLMHVKRSLRYTVIFMILLLPLIDFFVFEHYTFARNIREFRSGGWVSASYPESAVRFIKDNGLKGNIYNFYDWGGYLIWRFYPEKRVFIDGRQLYEYIYDEANKVALAIEKPLVDGMPLWKAILKRYEVDYILVPVSYMTGDVLPLIPTLFYDTEWSPIFIKSNSIIFARRVERNHGIIDKYGMSRQKALDILINRYEFLLAKNPDIVEFYLTLGDLYAVAKDFEKAREIYEAGLKIFSYNILLKGRLKGIEYKMKYYKEKS